jgi:NADPH2:quinone reductase
MHAWQLSQLGSIENLKLVRDLPDPTPAVDEVVLELEYAALNPADRYLAEGQYPARPPLPHILGRDGVGTVVAVGEGVRDVRVGDVKAILRGETGVGRAGTFATRVALNADSLIAVPAGWSHEQAACASLVYLTAHQAITQWDDLPRENCVTLITGASGGVGVAATQLAKAMGHTVIGVSRSEEKSRRLYDLGADFALRPDRLRRGTSAPLLRTKDTSEALMPRANLAIDNVGGDSFNDLLSAMDYAGRISVVGRLAGPVPSFNTASLFFRRLRIGGVAVGTYSREEAHAAWREVVALLARADQRPLIDQIFDFDQLPQAFERLHAGPMGKVLLRM